MEDLLSRCVDVINDFQYLYLKEYLLFQEEFIFKHLELVHLQSENILRIDFDKVALLKVKVPLKS